MLSLVSTVRIFVCTQPADMRRSFDGLSGMAQDIMKQDPLSGALFVFRNRNRDRLKIMYWDKDGLAIWYKRLEKGSFQLPTDFVDKEKRPKNAEISSEELSMLLGGIDLANVKRRKRFQPPNKPR
jgi:transposase